MRLSCHDPTVSGHIWISIVQQKYYIKVLPNLTIFELWGPETAAKKLKNIEKYNEVNGLIRIN